MAKHTKYTGYSSHPNKAARMAHAQAREQFSRYDTSAIRPKKSKKGKLIFVIALIILLAAIGAGVVFGVNSCLDAPIADGREVSISVKEGSTSADVAESLYSEGLIRNESDFLGILKDNGYTVKAGEYIFTSGQSAKKIAEQLNKGPNVSSGIIVAKGDKISSVAQKVEKYSKGQISADAFIKQCSNASIYSAQYPFLKDAGSNSLEGFLYPKTYLPKDGYTADSLVKDMLDAFETEVDQKILDKANLNGFTKYQVVTLASIVEKESTDETRKKVASVFLNRIEAGMPLQSDATTAYEVGHDPTSAEVHSYSKYSTYTNTGLPPTPICSPSLDSIDAVCNPENTDYLFFYFKNVDGQTKYYFSKTNEEHEAAIRGDRG